MYAPKLGFILSALPAAFAAVHDVSVGLGGNLTYNPPYVNAIIGDIVNFVFHPKNHTVTQSSFDTPCVPLPGGVSSGFVPVPAEITGLPNYPVIVNDTNPVWIHCGQVGHCGAGMVFAINPPADPNPHSFSAFKALAIATNGTQPTTNGTQTTTNGTQTITNGTQPTSVPAPVNHKITVGANGTLAYHPSNITAAIGDTVTFEFYPKNHTVTQSSFHDPCTALDVTTGISGVAFKSGFRPVAVNATTNPKIQITINDTAPIWGYCGQTGHCAAGMVFAINAVESGPNNFEAFVDLAKATNNTSQ